MTTGGNPTTALTLEDERQHLERLLNQHKRNLYRLELVKAQMGLHTPTAIHNELDYERQELARVQAMLRALEATPDPLARLVGQVRALLEAMGYQVTEEKPLARDQHQLMCQVSMGLGEFRRILLLCVDGEIGTGLVKHTGARLPTENAAQAILIAHARVAPNARRAAEESGGRVRAFTLADFYRQLIDFVPYIQGQVHEYENSELASYYVDLGCVKWEYDEVGRVVGEDVYKPMDSYVDRWLGEMGRNHLSILGDCGTGKTSFCRQYAAKVGRCWLEDPDRWRIPILISLRDYAKAMNLEQLVTDFLVNRCGIQASYRAFQRFNADGKLLLLFDGFDEMAQKTDYNITIANFWELAKAVAPDSKVLLTCRTPYFRTSREAWAVFRGEELALSTVEGPELGAHPDEPVIDLAGRPNFEIVHVQPFSNDDVRLVLQKRFPERWEGYYTQIQETYNLPDLAERPVLLDMIAQTLPFLRQGEGINAARLYQVYADLWLEREAAKGHTLLTPTDRRLFAEEIAMEMLRTGKLTIHHSRIPGRVKAHFRLEIAEEIDYYEADVRTCNFLNRDDLGNYTFVHESFMEFFAARRVISQISQGDLSPLEEELPNEVMSFASELLGETALRSLRECVEQVSAYDHIGQTEQNAMVLLDHYFSVCGYYRMFEPGSPLFRNKLTVVRGYLDMLHKYPGSFSEDEVARFKQVCLSSWFFLTELTLVYLDLLTSRPEPDIYAACKEIGKLMLQAYPENDWALILSQEANKYQEAYASGGQEAVVQLGDRLYFGNATLK